MRSIPYPVSYLFLLFVRFSTSLYNSGHRDEGDDYIGCDSDGDEDNNEDDFCYDFRATNCAGTPPTVCLIADDEADLPKLYPLMECEGDVSCCCCFVPSPSSKMCPSMIIRLFDPLVARGSTPNDILTPLLPLFAANLMLPYQLFQSVMMIAK